MPLFENFQKDSIAESERFKLLPPHLNKSSNGQEYGDPLSNEFTAIENVDAQYRFESIGCVPVPFRSSIVRVVVFKLIGTGVLAALMACSTTSRSAAKSCALAAAVNTIAVVHYWAIWRIRLQSFSRGPIAEWMIETSRKRKEEEEAAKEEEAAAPKKAGAWGGLPGFGR